MDVKTMLTSGFNLVCDVLIELFGVLSGSGSSLDWPMEDGRPSLDLGLSIGLDEGNEEFHPRFDA